MWGSTHLVKTWGKVHRALPALQCEGARKPWTMPLQRLFSLVCSCAVWHQAVSSSSTRTSRRSATPRPLVVTDCGHRELWHPPLPVRLGTAAALLHRSTATPAAFGNPACQYVPSASAASHKAAHSAQLLHTILAAAAVRPSSLTKSQPQRHTSTSPHLRHHILPRDPRLQPQQCIPEHPDVVQHLEAGIDIAGVAQVAQAHRPIWCLSFDMCCRSR